MIINKLSDESRNRDYALSEEEEYVSLWSPESIGVNAVA